jgi:hypothetical protein
VPPVEDHVPVRPRRLARAVAALSFTYLARAAAALNALVPLPECCCGTEFALWVHPPRILAAVMAGALASHSS